MSLEIDELGTAQDLIDQLIETLGHGTYEEMVARITLIPAYKALNSVQIVRLFRMVRNTKEDNFCDAVSSLAVWWDTLGNIERRDQIFRS